MDLLGGLGGRPSRWRRLSMSSQRCGAARSDFFYDICFYVVCGTACQTHFKVWTQLFAPSRDTPRAALFAPDGQNTISWCTTGGEKISWQT